MTTNRLTQLYFEYGQSAWLDNLRRDWIQSGELAEWVTKGCRGVTSNPTIFAKAMSGTEAYIPAISSFMKEHSSIEKIYWELVIQDIRAALEILHPVYEQSEGLDGYVSVEVSPELANNAEETIEAGKELAAKINAPNLYIKVPATADGVTAIEKLVAMGINVNVTLIFSLERYESVIQAYLSGLEQSQGDLGLQHSVASFFVSRVDTEVDRRLEELGSDTAMNARGKAAVAQAQAAYQIFLKHFESERYKKLESRGANLQRPLWASTSTKNSDYPDTLYVDSLIGPDTVNTLPDATIEAFLDHGTLSRTIDIDPEYGFKHLSHLQELGIDMNSVSGQLESEGVSSFSKSFQEALTTLKTESDALNAN